MERFVLALVLVVIGLPLVVFGVAVARQRFDLVFGDYTAETTSPSAWRSAHALAGRWFRRLGLLLVGTAPVVALVGDPVGGWIFGGAMAALVLGIVVVVVVALGRVEAGQRRR